MKDFKKYLLLGAVLALVPVCANAEISVHDTTTAEFIHNQGFSDEVKRIIDVKTVDPATPIPVSEEKHPVWKNIGWTILETIDPTYDRPNRFVNHSTQYEHSSPEDL